MLRPRCPVLPAEVEFGFHEARPMIDFLASHRILAFLILPLSAALLWIAAEFFTQRQAEEIAALSEQLTDLLEQERYSDALPLARRHADLIGNQVGTEHADYADALGVIVELLRINSHRGEAIPLLKRMLSIRVKALGKNDALVATTLYALGDIYIALGQFEQAVAPLERALRIRETIHVAPHRALATNLQDLGYVHYMRKAYDKAVPLLRRAVTNWEGVAKPESVWLADAVSILAEIYDRQNRKGEAERFYRYAVTAGEDIYGKRHLKVARRLRGLALFYVGNGRNAEAEPLLRRVLGILEQSEDANDQRVAAVLMDLAGIYRRQRKYDVSTAMLERVVEIFETSKGPDHPTVAVSMQDLAVSYLGQDRFEESEALFKRALAIYEAGDPQNLVSGLISLAELYRYQKRHAEAERLLQRALTEAERTHGPDSIELAEVLNNFALLYGDQGDREQAGDMLKRALVIREKIFGESGPGLATSLNNLAYNLLFRKRWEEALAHLRRVNGILTARDATLRNTQANILSAQGLSAAMSMRQTFHGSVRALRHIADLDADENGSLRDEAFGLAQRAQASRTARALAQMATRLLADESSLSNLVRERQDLAGNWQTAHQQLIAAISRPTGKRNIKLVSELQRKLNRFNARAAAIDRALAADFGGYSALTNPEPLTLATARQILGDNEVLVFFLDVKEVGPMPEESFVWALSKDAVEWARIPAGSTALAEKIRVLRSGFGIDRTRGAIISAGDDADLFAAAFDLYAQLLGPVESIIEGKELIIVPSGPLTSLPWQVLVSEPPGPALQQTSSIADAAWLVRDHAITILPSVASLAVLRQNAKASTAEHPFIGFGNPLLKGASGTDDSAFRIKSCADWDGRFHIASRGGAETIASYFRGVVADADKVRHLSPLPETTGELCGVARSLGAPQSEILLGASANEAAIKAMNDADSLSNYRIVHFATHGLVTGELNGLAEPALVLTPPDEVSQHDDGLLTASEVSQLRLDADWVVLSACNTASGEDGNAEALSGLARAFFYAGARALLVSHWPVNSQAAVELTTRTFKELETTPNIGRAEALRRSMLALIESGDPQKSHPAYWAPFMVVGEGAR